MTARDEALALLRERFPEPWKLFVPEGLEPVTGMWMVEVYLSADGTERAVRCEAYSEDGIVEAARACIEAWDEATKAERSAVVSAARAITSDAVDDMAAAGHRAVDIAMAALAAERALADRLAEALERAVDAADVCKRKHGEWQCDTGAHCVDASDCTGPALAAWRAARGRA